MGLGFLLFLFHEVFGVRHVMMLDRFPFDLHEGRDGVDWKRNDVIKREEQEIGEGFGDVEMEMLPFADDGQ